MVPTGGQQGLQRHGAFFYGRGEVLYGHHRQRGRREGGLEFRSRPG